MAKNPEITGNGVLEDPGPGTAYSIPGKSRAYEPDKPENGPF